MTRRNFFKYSALASTSILIPGFLKGLQANELNSTAQLKKLISEGKKLIIVQLSGGNDGLNTVIPYRNDIYYSMRPQISIGENILKLNDELGLNPVMNKLKEIYDGGNLSIINNVGYPNPDRSHFRSMD
ncbi:MAG: twin-arginine translocation pathway signal, partial [Ignavibacteria bacterium]